LKESSIRSLQIKENDLNVGQSNNQQLLVLNTSSASESLSDANDRVRREADEGAQSNNQQLLVPNTSLASESLSDAIDRVRREADEGVYIDITICIIISGIVN